MNDLVKITVLLVAFALPSVAPASEGQDIAAPEDVAAAPADAMTTDSGLASRVLSAGDGTEHPGPFDIVEVHYTGWTVGGTMFDSSVARGKKVGLRLDHLIVGWKEGLQLMVVGEKRRFWIPQELAFKGAKDTPAGMLVFDIELLEIGGK